LNLYQNNAIFHLSSHRFFFIGLSDLRANLIRHYFAVVDIRKDAGLIDGKYNTDENIGPSRMELELHEKMWKELYEGTV